MDQLDETARRIIAAAIEFYESHSGAGPEVYAYFDSLVPELEAPADDS